MGIFGDILDFGGDLIGGYMGGQAAKSAARQNYRAQKEFAQNGIQWKVADAQKAGIHPLYALGAQTSSFSPSFVGDNSFGTGIAEAGQDLGRAIDAARSPDQKTAAVQKTIQDLSITRMGLENDLLAAQIAKVRQAGQPPGIPSVNQSYLVDGQAPTAQGTITVKPLEQTASSPGAPFQEAGAINELGYAKTPTGWAPVMSNDVVQRLEDDAIGTFSWNLRNRILPTIGANKDFYKPPNIPLEPGKRWIYNEIKQEYQQIDKDSFWSKHWYYEE